MSSRAISWATRVALPVDQNMPLFRLTLMLSADNVQDCGDGYVSLESIARASGRRTDEIRGDFAFLKSLGIAELRPAKSDRAIAVFGMADRQLEHSSCPSTRGGEL